MQLTPEHVEAYAVLIGARAPERLLQGEPHRHRLALDAAGQVQAALWVEHLNESLTLLHGPFLREGGVPPAVVVALLDEALAVARAAQPPRMAMRVRNTADSPPLQAALQAAGFQRLGERIEFTAPLDEVVLEDAAASPLVWADLEAVGMPVVAQTLARAAVGDPHGLEADEDPANTIWNYLADGPLNSAPSCVQVGYRRDGASGAVPVAFVCAQVSPSTGWGRITYMGLVPEARGQGWGRWVHREGLAMLLAQGGKLYHGGTAAENGPMLRLFQGRGCRELRRMTEWVWHPVG